jgi:hypothetical protein
MKTTTLTQGHSQRQFKTSETETGDFLTTMWESWKGGEFTKVHSSEFTHTTKEESEKQHDQMVDYFKSMGFEEK